MSCGREERWEEVAGVEDRNRRRCCCCCRGNHRNDEVRGSRDYPCREALRNLERCLQGIEDRPSQRHCRCRCCCCCCNGNNSGSGNRTTWGREY